MSDSPLGNFLQLTDVLAWLNLDGSEVEEQLQVAVDAANDAVLDALQWDPRSQTVTEMVDGTGGTSLPVERAPISAVSAITVLPGCPGQPIALNLTNVTWHPKFALIYSTDGFAAGDANVQVTYTAGFTKTPGAILLAVRYTIRAMLDAAGVNFNSTGEIISGVSSNTWTNMGPGVVPPAALTLLHRYIKKF